MFCIFNWICTAHPGTGKISTPVRFETIYCRTIDGVLAYQTNFANRAPKMSVSLATVLSMDCQLSDLSERNVNVKSQPSFTKTRKQEKCWLEQDEKKNILIDIIVLWAALWMSLVSVKNKLLFNTSLSRIIITFDICQRQINVTMKHWFFVSFILMS